MTLTLGIDLGTSKVAAVILDNTATKVVAVSSQLTNAALPGPEGWFEQDVSAIWHSVLKTIGDLPLELRQRVSSIGVTGQMHGVTGWGPNQLRSLITWQDQRVTQDGFLDTLNTKLGSALHAGYGFASLAWLKQFQPEWFNNITAIGTVQDYLVSRLIGFPRPLMDPTDAASWGLFNLDSNEMQADKVAKLGLSSLVPELIPTGSRAGYITEDFSQLVSLPRNIAVSAAIGDNQASLFASLTDPTTDIALTLGTGGQVTVVVANDSREDFAQSKTMEWRPYLNNTSALVGASMAGGSAWAWLMHTAESWLADLGANQISRDSLYERISNLGLAAEETKLHVTPHFLGTRQEPDRRGSIEKIDLSAMSLGAVANSLADGIITGLRDLLPEEVYEGKLRVVGSGNGLRKSLLLRRKVEKIFGLPLVLNDNKEEAALGAAKLAHLMPR